MIAPQNRLLFWVGMVVLPFAAAGAVVSTASAPSIIIIGIFLTAVLCDAAFSLKLHAGISLEFPGVVRLSKDRDGAFHVIVKNNRARVKRLRLGLAFPQGILTQNEDLLVDLPKGNEVSQYQWPCRPVKRGRYLFDTCYLESPSSLGFWAIRSAVPANFEIRVYPSLFQERKNFAALFLNRGNFGIHAQRHVGQGRDFEKLREYVHGDSYDSIHWKVTAKRGRPVTKVYQIERTQEVYILIDASRLSARPSRSFSGVIPVHSHQDDENHETMLERFITAALVLGIAAERQGDLFGLLTFSNRVHSFIRAKNGKEHYNTCREALYTLESQTVTPDFDDLCAFLSLRLRRRALLIFLTNLDDPALAGNFVRNVDIISRKHLVLVNMMKHPLAQPLFSNPDVQSMTDLYRNLGGHILWHSLLELEKTLQRRGVRFSLLDNERVCSELVSQYISVKERQLL